MAYTKEAYPLGVSPNMLLIVIKKKKVFENDFYI
jgi:hypothetical protein